MPVSAMKTCFRIAERRTIFCKDTLKFCNFQIFGQFFALGDREKLFCRNALLDLRLFLENLIVMACCLFGIGVRLTSIANEYYFRD